MDDDRVLSRIDELVQEEEALLHRHEGEEPPQRRGARPSRGAARSSSTRPGTTCASAAPCASTGLNPDDASERDAGTVEDYEG